MKSTEILFFERPFPNANSMIIRDDQSFLVDTGFGSDIVRTEQLLTSAGILPAQLNGIINTHYHSDHVGGNHYFQQRYEIPVAAHLWEGEMVNQCDIESCGAHFLDQPVEQYTVQQLLVDEQQIMTGQSAFQVLHTPGHTLGHIALYEPKQEILICGDLFHYNDVGWLNIFREGTNSIRRSIESLDRLATLSIKKAYPGHGPAIDEPSIMIDKARERLEKWIESPEKMALHACKRIFSFTLMIKNGLKSREITPYLLSCSWFYDFAVHFFRLKPEEFVQPLLDEMIRSKAAAWHQGILIATAPYEAPNRKWIEEDWKPRNWTK